MLATKSNLPACVVEVVFVTAPVPTCGASRERKVEVTMMWSDPDAEVVAISIADELPFISVRTCTAVFVAPFRTEVAEFPPLVAVTEMLFTTFAVSADTIVTLANERMMSVMKMRLIMFLGRGAGVAARPSRDS